MIGYLVKNWEDHIIYPEARTNKLDVNIRIPADINPNLQADEEQFKNCRNYKPALRTVRHLEPLKEFTPDCYSTGTSILFFFIMICCIDPVLIE